MNEAQLVQNRRRQDEWIRVVQSEAAVKVVQHEGECGPTFRQALERCRATGDQRRNRLQARAVQVANQAVSAGLGNGTVISTRLPQAQFVANYNAGLYQGYIVINAEPFLVNANENPNDYAQGVYRGFTCVFTPLRGFKQVLFQLQITNLIAS